MPRIPKYRRHKGSNRAVVQYKPLYGDKRVYLPGDFNSPESLAAYEAIRQQVVASLGVSAVSHSAPAPKFVTSVVTAFLKHARTHYDPKEHGHYRRVGKMLFDDYGLYAVADFGPLKFRELREKMVDNGWCRNHVNRQAHRVRRIFKWGVSVELVPAEIYTALMTVEPLLKGKTRAPETEPKRPADWATVERLLPYLMPTVRAMVEIQWLTGMRGFAQKPLNFSHFLCKHGFCTKTPSFLAGLGRRLGFLGRFGLRLFVGLGFEFGEGCCHCAQGGSQAL